MCRGGDGHHDQLEERDRLKCDEARSEQHTSEPREQARKHPGESRDPLGIDAPLLGHPRALDDCAHPQPDAREAEHGRQSQRAHHSHGELHDLVACDGIAIEELVGGTAVGNDADGAERRLPVEVDDDLEGLGYGDEQT